MDVHVELVESAADNKHSDELSESAGITKRQEENSAGSVLLQPPNDKGTTKEKEEEEEEDDDDDDDDDDTTCCAKSTILNCCCTMNIYWRALVFFFIVSLYMGVGGAVFMVLEQPHERMNNQMMLEANMTLQRQLVMTMSTLRSSNGTLSTEEITELLSNITTLAQAAANIQITDNWDYVQAVFFAATVITTIGYGTIAPTTLAGQILFIPYSLIGIPITLVFLADLGQILNDLVNWSIKPLGKKRRKSVWVQTMIIISAGLIGLIGFILVPAAIFYAIDDWTYFQAVYYCFVTLTTVGFGDFVPTDTVQHFTSLYRAFALFWVFFGLAFLSLLIARVQEEITAFHKRAKKIRKCLKDKAKPKH